MMQREKRPPVGELEGLVLSDGSGAFYEVPTVVIARYRVPADEVASLGRVGQLSGADEPHGPAWTVYGGVYAPLTTLPGELDSETLRE